jgi:HNH endonuclease
MISLHGGLIILRSASVCALPTHGTRMTEIQMRNYSSTVMTNCERCGKRFTPHPSNLKRGGGRFCSRFCYRDVSPQERFWTKVHKTTTCWIWIGFRDWKGYGRFRLGERDRMAHVVSWIWEHGEPGPGMNILHKCDRPGCVRPDHLFIGTPLDNSRDMVAKGRSRRGEDQPNSKLTECQVIEMRALRMNGLKMRILSEMFGVCMAVVHSIVHRRTWRHI